MVNQGEVGVFIGGCGGGEVTELVEASGIDCGGYRSDGTNHPMVL